MFILYLSSCFGHKVIGETQKITHYIVYTLSFYIIIYFAVQRIYNFSLIYFDRTAFNYYLARLDLTYIYYFLLPGVEAGACRSKSSSLKVTKLKIFFSDWRLLKWKDSFATSLGNRDNVKTASPIKAKANFNLFSIITTYKDTNLT